MPLQIGCALDGFFEFNGRGNFLIYSRIPDYLKTNLYRKPSPSNCVSPAFEKFIEYP